jgi:hypothetical protein
MADVKIVELQVKTNIDGATQNIGKLKSGLKDATTESKALSESMSGGKPAEFINSIGDGISKLNPAFGGAVKGANGLLVKMWEMVANPFGAILAGVVLTLKFLYESFQSSVAGGKELKAIFATLSAIGVQVKDAMFGLGRALIDVATAAYKFITLDFKGAAESMKKANKEATESYKQLGNAIDGTTAKAIYNLEKQQQANDKARKLQAVTQSETNKLLVKSRETLTDETASLKDKKKALEEVTKAENASSKEKVRIAAEDLKIAQARAKALGGEEEKKAKVQLRELTIALNEAETENAMTGIKLNKQKKMLNRQEAADAKEAADAQKEALKTKAEAEKTALKEKEDRQKASFELEKNAVTEQLKNNKISIDEKRNIVLNDNKLSKEDRQKFLLDLQQQEIQAEENHNKAIADLNKKYDDEKANRLAETAVQKEELDYNRRLAEINAVAQTELERQTLIEKLDAEHKVRMGIANKADAKTQADIEQAKFNLKLSLWNQTASALGGLSNVFKKGTAAAKAAALAEIAIGSATGLINGLDIAQKSAKGTGPAAAFAFPLFYATQVAAVFGAVGRAKSVLESGGDGGGGGAAGGGSASAPTMTAPNFSVVGSSSTSQLAQTIGNQQNTPVQAYVVSNDVTTAQALDRNIIKGASL